MANPKSQQYEIIKNGPLCLDKFCADINPFGQGFNKKSSPLLGGAISNVFKKTEENINGYISNGNHEAWLDEDDYLCIDGKKTQYSFTNNQKFYVEELENDNGVVDASYLDYVDKDNYLRIVNSGAQLEARIDGNAVRYDYSASATYKVLEIYNTKYLAILKPKIENDKINGTFELRTSIGLIAISSSPIFANDSSSRAEYYNVPANFNNFIIEVKKIYKEDAPHYHIPLISIYALDSNGYLHFDWSRTNSWPDYPGVENLEHGNSIPSIGYFMYYINPNTNAQSWIPMASTCIFFSEGTSEADKAVQYYRFGFDSGRVFETLLEASNYAGLRITLNVSGTSGLLSIEPGADRWGESGNPTHFSNSVLEVKYNFRNRPEDRETYYLVPSACFYKNKYLENWPFFRFELMPNVYANDTMNGFIYCSDATIDFGASFNFYSANDDNTISALVGSLEDDEHTVPRPKFAKRLTLGYLNKDPRGNNTTSYEVLVDENNFIQGFSYARGGWDRYNNTCINLGTLLIPMGTVSNERPIHFIEESESYDDKYIVYFDNYTNTWKRIGIKAGIDLWMDDDFILINTTKTYNAIRISDLTQHIWANDWNNRVVNMGGYFKGYSCVNPDNSEEDIHHYYYFNKSHYGFINPLMYKYKREVKISSAFNYYKNSTGIPSSQLPEQTLYLYTLGSKDAEKCHPEDTFYYKIGGSGFGCDIYSLEIYKNGRYSNSMVSKVILSFFPVRDPIISFFIDSELVNTTYLVDSLYYTPAITMEFRETYSNKNLVYYDKMIYSLRYYGDERKEKLLYPLLTQYFGIDEIFVIQGQRYFIQNNKIYSFNLTADDEIMDSIIFITNIQGLEFKANTTREAYFWSKNDSSLYIFTADNILRKAYTATEINDIYNAIYYPSLDATIFSTNIGLLCISDRFGMFVIPNDSVDPKDKLYLNTKGYITLFNDTESLIDYYNLWFINSGWEKLPIKLSTKFYGLGSNLISITDTWYFRLFADKSIYEDMEYPRTGEIKLSVDVLTDRGLSTESKIINIDEKDWDSLTDTVYLRYQPKLQRGVGISINVESPFAIGYLGVGTTPETLQLSKPSLQA